MLLTVFLLLAAVVVDAAAVVIDVIVVGVCRCFFVSHGQVLRRSDGKGDRRAPDARQREPGPHHLEQMVLMPVTVTRMAVPSMVTMGLNTVLLTATMLSAMVTIVLNGWH